MEPVLTPLNRFLRGYVVCVPIHGGTYVRMFFRHVFVGCCFFMYLSSMPRPGLFATGCAGFAIGDSVVLKSSSACPVHAGVVERLDKKNLMRNTSFAQMMGANILFGGTTLPL